MTAFQDVWPIIWPILILIAVYIGIRQDFDDEDMP